MTSRCEVRAASSKRVRQVRIPTGSIQEKRGNLQKKCPTRTTPFFLLRSSFGSGRSHFGLTIWLDQVSACIGAPLAAFPRDSLRARCRRRRVRRPRGRWRRQGARANCSRRRPPVASSRGPFATSSPRGPHPRLAQLPAPRPPRPVCGEWFSVRLCACVAACRRMPVGVTACGRLAISCGRAWSRVKLSPPRASICNRVGVPQCFRAPVSARGPSGLPAGVSDVRGAPQSAWARPRAR